MTVFVAVVDAGGFASAARRLGLSAPVVTRAIADLEAHLKLRLLTRTTRHLRATDAGTRYAEDCRRILAQVDDAEAAATGASAIAQGTLTVTAPVLFGQSYVMPILTRYLEQNPQVDANGLWLDRVVNLMEEGVDVAVRIGELPDSSLLAVRVGQVRRVVVAAPAYLERRGMPKVPNDLLRHAIVAAGGITPQPEWRFANSGGKPQVLRLRPRLHTNSNESAIAAAVAGFGLSSVLSYQVAAQVRNGSLRIVLEDHETAAQPIHVVHLEGRRATQKVRGFIDLAVESLRADPSLR